MEPFPCHDSADCLPWHPNFGIFAWDPEVLSFAVHKPQYKLNEARWLPAWETFQWQTEAFHPGPVVTVYQDNGNLVAWFGSLAV